MAGEQPLTPFSQGNTGAGTPDVVNKLQAIATNLSSLNSSVQAAFPRITGSFTLSAATTTLVTQPAIGAQSIIVLTPTNATAALIQRTNGVYHSANAPGASFSVSTQAGSAVAGGTFEYIVVNPS